MPNYIDGFILPIPSKLIEEYKKVAEQVAEIWKEYGAIAYYEYLGDDLHLEGTRSFAELVELKEDEVVVFGWAVFPSEEVRIAANKAVPKDPRMAKLVGPLLDPNRPIFDATRMVYGGFNSLVNSEA